MNADIFKFYLSLGFIPVRINTHKHPQDLEWNTNPPTLAYDPKQLYGFMPPKDIVIVDVDVKNGKDGIDSLLKFINANPNLPTELHEKPLVFHNIKTPSGGFHYYFRLSPTLDYLNIPKTHPAYPGIDFITHGKAQAVAGGQQLSSGWYSINIFTIHQFVTSFLPPPDITPAPDTKNPSQPPKVYSQTLQSNSIDSNLTLHTIRTLLTYIPADSYDDWYKVAFSLMSTPYTNQEQFELWVDWSSRSSSFVSVEDCENKWRSLTVDYKKPGKELEVRTVGSLVWMAKHASPASINEINNLIHTDDIDSLKGRLCRVQSVVSSVHYYDLKIQAWLNEAGAVKTMQPLIDYLSQLPADEDNSKQPRAAQQATQDTKDTKDNKPRRVKVNIQTLVNKGLIHIPVDKVYYPDKPSPLFYDNHGALYLNTYSLESVPAPLPYKVSQSVNFFTQHATQIFGQKYVNDFLSFIAYLTQNPGKKIRWMLVLEGGKGTGKGLLLQAIKNHVLGVKNCNLINTNEILSEHNSWAFDYQLIHIDELMIRGKGVEKYMNTLKTLITEDVGLRREKYLVSSSAPCCASFIALTNHKNSLKHADSRRYHAIISPIRNPQDIKLGKFATSIEYYKHLASIASSDNAEGGHLREFFLNYQIPASFSPDKRPEDSDFATFQDASNKTDDNEDIYDLICNLANSKTLPQYFNAHEVVKHSTALNPDTNLPYFDTQLTLKSIKKFAKSIDFDYHGGWCYSNELNATHAKSNILQFCKIQSKLQSKDPEVIFTTHEALEYLKSKTAPLQSNALF